MLIAVLICYFISLILQGIAAVIGFSLSFRAADKYRWAWLGLSIGLALMIIRRIGAINQIYLIHHYSFFDAAITLIISATLMIGIYGIKKSFQNERSKNTALKLLGRLDVLTNCLNRQEIHYQIAQEIERSLRNKEKFSLLELDIDHFKNINDSFGHQVGDEMLASLVRCIQATLRQIDHLGRIGGEEFLILLPGADEIEAMNAAERIRKHIANTQHITSWSEPLQITVSIGVTTFMPGQQNSLNKADLLTKLVNDADKAMYCAKNSGRNCSSH